MHSPFFSIIIPTFNRAHFLTRTIPSIINQTFEDWELILVDDGSTDNTAEVATSYANSDKRIKYIYQENKKVSAARNNGLNNATGKYLCFLDSDDEFMSNHLATFYKEISNGSADNLLFSHFVTSDNNKLIPFTIPRLTKEYPEKVANILKVFLPYSPPVQTICVPSYVKESVRFNEKMILTECYDFCAKCADKLPVKEIDVVTIIMHAHQSNISVARNIEQAITFNERHLHDLLIMKADSFYDAIKRTSVFKSKIQSVYFDLIKLHFSKKEIGKALGYFSSILSTYPSIIFSKTIAVLLIQILNNKSTK